MTTIVYDHENKIVAYDSRVTRKSLIISDTYDKLKRIGDLQYIVIGYIPDALELMKLYRGQLSSDEIKRIDSSSMIVVLDNAELYACYTFPAHTRGYIIEKLDRTTAYGSGMGFALTALDCGCSAVEAVQKAALRDVNTGGKIRSVELGNDS